MISIRHNLSELEKAYNLRETILECYRSAILTAAQYAVELDDKQTALYREHLTGVAAAISPELAAEQFEESRSSVRDAFRNYRDQASTFLNDLRQELASKASSLQRVFEAMSANDEDHETRISKTLACLRDIASDPRAAPFRPALLSAADSLARSLEDLKRQNQLTVAQFQVEVQMLHERIDSLQTASSIDASTRLATRSRFEGLLQNALQSGEPLALLLLHARALETLRRQFGDGALQCLLSAFAKRLRTCLAESDSAARWQDDQFVVLLAERPSSGRALARRVAEHTSGTYICVDEGRTTRPVMQVDVGLVDSGPSPTMERLTQRIEEFFRACG